MSSVVVRCDGCGVDLDTDTRFDGEARRRAAAAGWSSPPVYDWRREGPDYCPACVARGLVSRPVDLPPLIVETFQTTSGKTVTFVKTEAGWRAKDKVQ